MRARNPGFVVGRPPLVTCRVTNVKFHYTGSAFRCNACVLVAGTTLNLTMDPFDMHAKHLLRTLIATAAAVSAFAVPTAAAAATATGTVNVTANVTAVCLVSATTNVAFGAYDTTVATNLLANGSISIACTKNTAITSIDLNNGVNASGTIRRMTNGTDFITYDLYKPSGVAPGAACAYTAAWTTGTTNGLVPVAAPSNAPRVFNVCGQTAQGQNVGTGAYSDTVTVTVNY